jgi:uncharacterized repeat protein (TIGR01451 family)
MSFRSLVLAVVAPAILSLIAATPLQAQEADLGVSKSGPASAAADADVPYTITVTNFGPDDSSTVQLSDPMPAGMTFVSATQDSGPLFSCTTPPIGGNGTIDCTIATLTAGSTASFTFTFHIPPDVAPDTFFTNIATVSALTLDPNDENNSAPATTAGPSLPQADLGVMKTGPESAAPDTDVTYTITVSNFGPADASSVSFDDTLPGTMTFGSVTQNSGPAFTCPPPQGNAVVCSIATLTAGSTATFTLVGHIPAGTPSGTTFTNTAFTSAETSDPNTENNSSTTQLIVASADVSITKSAPASVAAGATMSYVVTVTNNGPDQAQNVTFTDPLPGATTFVSRTQNTGPAALCSEPLSGTNGTVSCTIAALNNGQSAQFTILVHVNGNAPAGSIISNTAGVSTNGTTDPNNGNDSANALSTVTVQSDVSVTKNGPATINAGANITYTIAVPNAGPSDAATVTLNDTAPPNTTFVSFASPAGWSCTTPVSGGTGAISCSATSLASGATANFTLVLHVSSAAPSASIISNVATVTTANDPNAGNNSSTSNATVTASADLAVTKNGPASASPSGSVVYTIGVTNNGLADAQSVSLNDTTPSNTTFTSLVSPGGWSCTTPASGGTGAISCTTATLANGATATFTLTLAVNGATPNGTVISNTATVSSTTSDPNAGNNSATSNATVSVSADVAVTKSAPATIAPNGSIAYTIGVTNNGPNVAQNVSLSDTLPASTTFTSLSSPGGWSCTTPAVGGTGTVTCSIATLANAATASFTLTVATTAPAGSTITNTANVSATSPDSSAGNNSATASTVVGAPDVAIVKTVTPSANIPNGPETYTIVVTNNGPGTATGVTVTDILPAGTTFTSANASQGSCTGTTTVTCNVGSLNNGASATVTIVVQAPPTLGPVANTATVSTTSSDPNPANNSSTASFNVVAAVPAMSPFALLLTAIALALGGAIALKARG